METGDVGHVGVVYRDQIIDFCDQVDIDTSCAKTILISAHMLTVTYYVTDQAGNHVLDAASGRPLTYDVTYLVLDGDGDGEPGS